MYDTIITTKDNTMTNQINQEELLQMLSKLTDHDLITFWLNLSKHQTLDGDTLITFAKAFQAKGITNDQIRIIDQGKK